MAPPKPRLVLRIGMSGHRPNRFTPDAQEKVRASLGRIFGTIHESVTAIREREAAVFDAEPPQLRIVTALAEGADRVIANAALEAGHAIDAIIPFAPEDYATDFDTAESKDEFRRLLERARTRFSLPGEKSATDPARTEHAYEAVGLMTLRQCDILVAVWNGEEASGRGGTADIVQRAIASRIPVLRFAANGDGPYLLKNDGPAPADALDLVKGAAVPIESATLHAIVESLTAPPSADGDGAAHGTQIRKKARRRLDEFLAEPERRWNFAFSYPLLLRIFNRDVRFWRSFRQKPYYDATVAEWAGYFRALQNVPAELRKRLLETVTARHSWPDKLAIYYGQKHRSGYVRNFSLAAVAVLFALLSFRPAPGTAGQPASPFSVEHLLHVGEFVSIGAIILLTGLGLRWRRHQRWLDYRQLSEQLRHLRALLLIGSSSPEARPPRLGEELQPGPLWVNWYYRAVVREAGVPCAAVDADYLAAIRQAIAEGEIADQAGYHTVNARRIGSVAHWLEWLGVGFFIATFAICTVLAFCSNWLDGLTGSGQFAGAFLCALLPAVGAAAYGIRVEGDFDGSCRRSANMARRLIDIGSKLSDKKKPMSLAEVSALTEDATLAMMSEIGDWGFIYRGRPLALPA